MAEQSRAVQSMKHRTLKVGREESPQPRPIGVGFVELCLHAMRLYAFGERRGVNPPVLRLVRNSYRPVAAATQGNAVKHFDR